jgi:hypothetical protein
MIIPGLVSITFRKLAPAEIITLVRQADLQAIEWGGDVHVPHGNVRQVREVPRLTEDAGPHGGRIRVVLSARQQRTEEACISLRARHGNGSRGAFDPFVGGYERLR